MRNCSLSLLQFARTHNLLCITIDELIEYRARNERLVEVVAEETLPTAHGEFTVKSFKSVLDGTEHLALIMGEVRTIPTLHRIAA
jgi:3,4-dihydroxy 2-butanone 4-phosphate synthase/GTP cyclohydrolase II